MYNVALTALAVPTLFEIRACGRAKKSLMEMVWLSLVRVDIDVGCTPAVRSVITGSVVSIKEVTEECSMMGCIVGVSASRFQLLHKTQCEGSLPGI